MVHENADIVLELQCGVAISNTVGQVHSSARAAGCLWASVWKEIIYGWIAIHDLYGVLSWHGPTRNLESESS